MQHYIGNFPLPITCCDSGILSLVDVLYTPILNKWRRSQAQTNAVALASSFFLPIATEASTINRPRSIEVKTIEPLSK